MNTAITIIFSLCLGYIFAVVSMMMYVDGHMKIINALYNQQQQQTNGWSEYNYRFWVKNTDELMNNFLNAKFFWKWLSIIRWQPNFSDLGRIIY